MRKRENGVRRGLSLALTMALVFGMLSPLSARAAESKNVTFNPTTGDLEYTFGFQATQYVNIDVEVKPYQPLARNAVMSMDDYTGVNNYPLEERTRQLYAEERAAVQIEPSESPAIPSESAPAQSEMPVDPSDNPTVPSEAPTEPSTEPEPPTAPSEEPTEPSAVPETPAVPEDTTEPSEEGGNKSAPEPKTVFTSTPMQDEAAIEKETLEEKLDALAEAAKKPGYSAALEGMKAEQAAVAALSDPGVAAGRLVSDWKVDGAVALPQWIPEDDGYESKRTMSPSKDNNVSGITAGPTYPSAANPTVMLRENTLVWNGSMVINGKDTPVIGPNLEDDMFVLEFLIEPLGLPDQNKDCEDVYDIDGNFVEHIHGFNYTWPHINGNKIKSRIVVDYRNYIEGESGPTFLMLPDGLSDQIIKEVTEAFFNGSLDDYLLQRPELKDILLPTDAEDPVNMVTGTFHSSYTDMRLEGSIPLTFVRAYNSRYDGGSLGKGFTHGYEYSLRDEAGKMRVTMPGGEEQIFLRLVGGGYKSLQASEFTLSESGSDYIMAHQQGAQFIFDNSGNLTTVKNPNGVSVATLTYGASGGLLSHIEGVSGFFDLAWDGGYISKVTDSAGRVTEYGHIGNLLASVTNPDGDTLTYAYDSNGYASSIKDFTNTEYIRNVYDSVGRVVSQEFVVANEVRTNTFTYDDATRTNSHTDTNGVTTTYHYDEHRNILYSEVDGKPTP